MAETVLGDVERVTFENEETGFRVLRLGNLSGLSGRRTLTAVGVMPAVGAGTRVRISGRIENDPRHGERLKVESLVAVAPDSLEGLERYLASGVISGVGLRTAQRIVTYFGLDSLRVLDQEAHRLAEVPGIGRARVERIRAAWNEHRAMSNVLLALGAHGASPALAARIVKHFGEKAAEVVQKNPYRLAIDIVGVGFKTADQLARAQGLSIDHPERVQAGVLHELRAWADAGHCHSSRELLLPRAAEMLGVEEAHVDAAIDALWAAGHLVVEDEAVYLQKLHAAEVRVATRLMELLRAPSRPVANWAQLLAEFERTQGISLAPAQRRAVQAAAEEKVLVITGGPGVGKTTLVRAIVATFEQQKLRIHLAAPTGRAAKRLSESTGRRAQTIHRLLEVEGHRGKFARHAEHPLETDLLIVDESSMVDVHLAASLLDAVPNAARLVVVGDADQLPSVGPGAVLGDVIASGVVPVARLDVIFRQDGQSGIIENSHRILRGEAPFGADDKEGDFFVIQCKEPERAVQLVRQVVKERIPARFGLDPVRDVQVLTPMHKGPAGTINLNDVLQSDLNPNGASFDGAEQKIRVGDKVLQLKNNYDKRVFNGDMGEVVGLEREPFRLTVQFEDDDGPRPIAYERGELSQLGLAYATSIHKSQGSEYPAVVIPFLTSHFVMLSRNLLYTAVTRAKKLCVLVADERAIRIALGETRREARTTGLTRRLTNEAE